MERRYPNRERKKKWYLSERALHFYVGFLSVAALFLILFEIANNQASIHTFLYGLRQLFLIALIVAASIIGGTLLVVAAIYGHRAYDYFYHKHQERLAHKHRVSREALENEGIQERNRAIRQAADRGQGLEHNDGRVKISEIRIPYAPSISSQPQRVLTESSQQTQRPLLPQPFTFSSVLTEWEPSPDGILLAQGHEFITVPIGEELCHTTFTGATDAGKTNDERLILIQLLYLEQAVYMADYNWQPFRQDRKNKGVIYDYTPIQALLAHEPIVTTPDVVKFLQWLYSKVEARRVERRKVQTANALAPFPDLYAVFDELPAFASEDKRVMELIGRLVREARQYGVFFIGSAQDLLNATLQNDNGAIRKNLLTNYYGGGDHTTARLVLNLQRGERIEETGLGIKGLKYLRAKGAGIEHERVRTPLADDKATHILLDDMARTAREDLDIPYPDDKATPDDSATETSGTLNITPNESDRIIEVFNRGVPRRKICGVLGKGKSYYPIVKAVLDELEGKE